MGRGACAGDPGATRLLFSNLPSEQWDAARKWCAHCRVRPQCLAYALANFEKEGVWGGFTAADRLRFRKWDRFVRKLTIDLARDVCLEVSYQSGGF